MEKALKEPDGSKRPSEIARAEHKVAIIVDDSTRHAPSGAMILQKEFRKATMKLFYPKIGASPINRIAKKSLKC